jgi:cytoskeletal protein RodZ
MRLRIAREAKGLSLKQVADATKLSVRSIEALENDRIDSLPEGIYRRAMIRSVAGEVGLKPDDIFNAFETQHPDALPAAQTIAALTESQSARRSALQPVLALAGACVPIVSGVLYFGFAAIARRCRCRRRSRPRATPMCGGRKSFLRAVLPKRRL